MKNKTIYIIIGIVLVGLFLYSSGMFDKKEAQLYGYKCTSLDAWRDYSYDGYDKLFTRRSVSYDRSSAPSGSFTDECINSNTLREYTCDYLGDNVEYDSFDCPGGCSNGACQKQCTSGQCCYTNEWSSDLWSFRPSSHKIGSTTYFCQGDDRMWRETYCTGTHSSNTRVETGKVTTCQYGCENGVCKSAPPVIDCNTLFNNMIGKANAWVSNPSSSTKSEVLSAITQWVNGGC
jgi:hypothetical protein